MYKYLGAYKTVFNQEANLSIILSVSSVHKYGIVASISTKSPGLLVVHFFAKI